MRIISGRYRGLQLKTPGNLPVRPTTDFAKTGLFNILNNRYDLQECEILDLYAGTGNLSFEFVSRGAKSVTSVDKDPGCIRHMKTTVRQLGEEKVMHVIQSEALRYLSSCSKHFDIIVADPPYAITPGEELLQVIQERSLLTSHGIFILEHSREREFRSHPLFTDKRIYGQVAFSFFESAENLTS